MFDTCLPFALLIFGEIGAISDDLGAKELKVMKEWEVKYVEKYPIVGVLLGKGTAGDPNFVPGA